MVDHKVVEVQDEWIKVDKEYAGMIQSEVDNLLVTARMMDYEIVTQYHRHNDTITGVFLYLIKDVDGSEVKYKLDFIMNSELKLKQIRFALNGLGEVAIGKPNKDFIEPIKRLKEML